jgi:hypothetical protein
MEHMQRTLIAGGATVLTFTLPDLTPVMPIARWIAPRIHALNAALRSVAANTGGILVDFAAYELGSDIRFWSGDRIHANATGHARIADALAHAIGLPGSDDSWKLPLPPLRPRTRWEGIAAETGWALRHFVPWMARGVAAGLVRHAHVPREASLKAVRPAS